MVRAIKILLKIVQFQILTPSKLSKSSIKFHYIMLIVSVTSSFTVLFIKATPGSVPYYMDATITATAQALLVGVWYGVDDVEDV